MVFSGRIYRVSFLYSVFIFLYKPRVPYYIHLRSSIFIVYRQLKTLVRIATNRITKVLLSKIRALMLNARKNVVEA
jgi:hypothetical protein